MNVCTKCLCWNILVCTEVVERTWLKNTHIPNPNCYIVAQVWNGYCHPFVLCCKYHRLWPGNTLTQPDWLTVQQWPGSCKNTPRLAKVQCHGCSSPVGVSALQHWGNTDPPEHHDWNQRSSNRKTTANRQTLRVDLILDRKSHHTQHKLNILGNVKYLWVSFCFTAVIFLF